MNFPAELKYTKDHEWVKMLDDTTALVGISDFAQSELGDLVFVNLPAVGDDVVAGEAACDVESVKAVSGASQLRYLRRMDHEDRKHHRFLRASERGGV